ncbi:MAG TPA: glycosyltransferase family 1 protein [Gaiellales bacterium]|nr:glycosyltransferase family 1 protein [Gaiellales bacterium]
MTPLPPVDVALAMLTLVPGAMGGSETYARALTRELSGSHNATVTAYVAQIGAGFSQGVPERVVPGVAGGASTRSRLTTLAQAARHRQSIRESWAQADVVHYPFTAPVPGPAAANAVVVSLLDVQHLDLPALFSRAERLYRRRFYDTAARRADLVVTISEFTRSRIVALLGIEPERVVVAPLGVDASDFEPNLGARENLLLYPARGWPHKNHAGLFEAFSLLRAQDPALRLVLTGGALDGLGPLPAGVESRGLVERGELRELYRTAAALVFPSLYEGFGLPPLEAMASGCPVAASRAGSLPEVCGDAAVLFDAADPAAIAAGVREAIARTAELRERGLARARSFTWAACAEAHERAYRLAASGSRPRGNRR